MIFDTFQHLLEGVTPSDVSDTVGSPIVRSRMVDRRDDKLFSSAGCVLTYWLVEKHFNEMKRLWPDASLVPGLQLVCADLGFSYE
jgi:hypothetical protein